MSRIGLAPITVPSGVDVIVDGTTVTVKGKMGTLTRTLSATMKIDLTDGVITVARPNDEPDQRALHGLTRSLLNNMVIGCADGFSKRLELIGTGYRVQQKGKALEVSVGFSHPVPIQPIGENTLAADGATFINISGPNKEDVGEQAAQIRKVRKPNPYTGKGIKYSDETIRRKAGKTAVGVGI
ncbi:MAG TPA: 50S ribosomal protein L6 [Dehalococcoidia bacterium]|nr:50S ribosomal protein L6 [Chloroflexota bacterium]MDP6056295.1 50S ribosomal protein L6 [Dehalococcoidia bacterium]MDP7090317.1 50S ribosomal protein L6 [Dehalococcoidia bacterium]MDP7261026.1 50S ribosomal protein L6 [Dehalococcoidia bacterium]MDP7485135.1 50S ribosomal protein L6 [Dehalococcoidia bacterium]